MSAIKLFTKYLDKQNRKFIVVERFATVDFEKKTEVPSSIKLLDVNGECTTMITHNEFITYTLDGRLRQVTNF